MLDKIKEIIDNYLKENNIELVDIVYRRESGRYVLRLLVDKEGGITLGECAHINQSLGNMFDAADIIKDSYTLEVDSPGVDRWFQSKRDYERSKGRKVRVTLNEAILDKKEYIGSVEEVSAGFIKVNVKEKGIIQVPFDKIIRARQEI